MLFEIVFLAPLVATIISILCFTFVFLAFYNKPRKLKIWLMIALFFFIPWSALTVLMRIAENENQALWLLRGSFISLQISFYASYRFHTAMTYKAADKRIAIFGLAIITGFNIALSFNNSNLKVVFDSSGNYYTDQFGIFLMIPNIIVGTWSAYYVFKALNEMDAFSVFYSPDGNRNTRLIFTFGFLIISAFVVLIQWLSQSRKGDSTPFIIIISLALVFLGFTYGINPTSKILAPQRIWSFLIVNKSGLPVYEHHFSKDENLGELSLVAMAITAGNSTIMNFLDSPTPVNAISLEGRTVLIVRQNELMFCLIADHRSIQLFNGLNEVVKKIVNHPKFRLPKLGEQLGVFAYTTEILTEIFSSGNRDNFPRRSKS